MSEYAEVFGQDVDAWREHVESQVTENPVAFGERLDELQATVNSYGWYIGNGHEFEFELVSRRGRVPDRREFYMDYLHRVRDRRVPPRLQKGAVVDPRNAPTPVFITLEPDGTFEWEPHGNYMETATMPSVDWRETERRKWHVLGTLGEMAVEYGCKVKILSTHMSTSNGHLDSKGDLVLTDNFTGTGDMLLAMQQARSALYGLEPYASLMWGRGETAPTKTVLWALFRQRVETRFPAFGIADTRLAELAPLAGVDRLLRGDIEPDYSTLHPCAEVELYSECFPELNTLAGMMVWDYKLGRMVLPEIIARGRVAAAMGTDAPERLDRLVRNLSASSVTDFSKDNGQMLREAVHDLVLTSETSVSVANRSAYRDQWQLMLEDTDVTAQLSARIALPPEPDAAGDYISRRQRAAASPEVAAILGKELLRSLTDPRKAYRLREMTRRTRTKPVAAIAA